MERIPEKLYNMQGFYMLKLGKTIKLLAKKKKEKKKEEEEERNKGVILGKVTFL